MNSPCIECQTNLSEHNPVGLAARSVLIGWKKCIHHYALMIKRRRVDRRALKDLAELDDAGLQDIGLTRNDVLWASHLPLSEHASMELEKIARRPKSF